MVTVYFATNRQPIGNNDFGSDFSPDGLANLRFGRAEVTGTDFNQITVTVAPENLFLNPPLLGSETIFQEVRQRMKKDAADLLLFIHGFNTPFRNALRSAAQIYQVLTATNDPLSAGKPPLRLIMFVFSWPSDGSMLLTNPNSRDVVAYKNDRLDALASGAAFARGFLKLNDFINAATTPEEQCNQRLHLLAHSMGNYVLRSAVQEMRKFVDDSLPRIFDQILMMAADEDDDTFDYDHKLRLLPRITRRTSVYFNRNDLALWASDNIKGNVSRLGTDGPLQPRSLPRNIYPIDCTDVISSTEHSYHVVTDRVIVDMRQVIRNAIPDEIPGRKYVPETNRYRLLKTLTPQSR
jgi:esterase/lipase superfamily enzyme